MRPKTLTQTGVGTSTAYPIDWRQQNFQVSLGGSVSGTATYTVQHTFDNILDPAVGAGGATWYNHSFLAGQTGSADGNYAFPVTGIRINQTAGTGTTSLRVVQTGDGG